MIDSKFVELPLFDALSATVGNPHNSSLKALLICLPAIVTLMFQNGTYGIFLYLKLITMEMTVR